MHLRGQVGLVTGAGRGIGREVALALAADGMAVGLVGRDPGRLAAVRADVAAAGGRALDVEADVTDGSAVRSAVAVVEQRLGPVDLLVSNAGTRERAPAAPWAGDPQDWWRTVETNLRGPFLVLHAVVPGMVARGRGRVLHVGSGMGQRPNSDWSAYAVSKAALSRLTDSVSAALAGTGVTVLEASPGLVRTDLTETMWGAADAQPWNPASAMTRLVTRFARGELDRLHGRFVHAVRDDVDDLLALADLLRDRDARTLRLRPYGDADPLG